MKHALIVGHPDEASFALSVARTYQDEAERCGHAVVVRDLYRMGFDPILTDHERPDRIGRIVAADVAAEHQALADADVLVFIYPVWFGLPPAMVTGYVQRVFGPGFAFQHQYEGRTDPLLQGRQMVSFTSSGSSGAWFAEQGLDKALRRVFDDYLAHLMGFTVLDHVHFGSIGEGLGPRWVQERLDTVRARFHTAFPQAVRAP
jgi:NAD(P)H dehydrogenase (quinone)